jgi:predicted nucleotidyltransferase
MPEHNLRATLRALHEGRVEFILVDGLAAVLQGAPVHTFDVDVVYSQETANITRILAVLEALEAVFRIQPERRLQPTITHLAGSGHLSLITSHGPLDLLATTGHDLRYQDLLPDSIDVDIGDGIRIRVLTLDQLICLKEDLAGEKDRVVLPILRRTLEEKNKSKDS